MSGARGERSCDFLVATLAADATTPEIAIGKYAAGMVYIPSGSPITSLTYYAAFRNGQTYIAAYDQAGNAITQTVTAGKAYAMPSDLFGAGRIKIVANEAGLVELSLKS